jgi:hypothetical protein
MEPLSPKPAGLGSLAKSARGKQLRQARTILFVVGVLQIITPVIFMALAPQMIHKEIEAEVTKIGGPGRVDPAVLKQAEETALRINYLVNGGFILLGILFIVFGFIIYQYPVPVTVTSLVLFIGANLGVALLEPESLARGIIVKVIFVVALVKAVQAAVADRRERTEELAGEATGP